MLQNKNICVSLHSQLNMVPIVQLVRASDCGSECRGFESHWAPKRATSQEVAFFVYCGEPNPRVRHRRSRLSEAKESHWAPKKEVFRLPFFVSGGV